MMAIDDHATIQHIAENRVDGPEARLAREIVALRKMVADLLPFADFGERMMDEWQENFDVDACDRFDWAKSCGVLVAVPGGFDPEKHSPGDFDPDPGDDWVTIIPMPDAIAAHRAKVQS